MITDSHNVTAYHYHLFFSLLCDYYFLLESFMLSISLIMDVILAYVILVYDLTVGGIL